MTMDCKSHRQFLALALPVWEVAIRTPIFLKTEEFGGKSLKSKLSACDG